MPGFYFWEPLGSWGSEDFAVASFLNIALVRTTFCLACARNGYAVRNCRCGFCSEMKGKGLNGVLATGPGF